MHRAMIPLPIAVTALLGTAYWHFQVRGTPSLISLGVAVIGMLAAIVHPAILCARKKFTDEEEADKERRKKMACEYASTQAKNEMTHFEAMLENPASCAGRRYAEQTSFEFVAKRMQPLLSYPEFAEQAQWVTDECERNLKLPSGQKDVKALVIILKKLIEDLDASFHDKRY